MNKRRLQVLEVFLRTRAAKLTGRFDLGDWVLPPAAASLVPVTSVDFVADQDKLDCGFAGCAVGWAAVIPAFRRRGLRLTGDFPVVFPAHDGLTRWPAVAEFFGLSTEQAERLFGSKNYPPEDHTNPLAVADRIREFVTHNTPTEAV